MAKASVPLILYTLKGFPQYNKENAEIEKYRFFGKDILKVKTAIDLIFFIRSGFECRFQI